MHPSMKSYINLWQWKKLKMSRTSRQKLKKNAQEVKQQEDSLTRESIYDLLLEVNKFSALVQS